MGLQRLSFCLNFISDRHNESNALQVPSILREPGLTKIEQAWSRWNTTSSRITFLEKRLFALRIVRVSFLIQYRLRLRRSHRPSLCSVFRRCWNMHFLCLVLNLVRAVSSDTASEAYLPIFQVANLDPNGTPAGALPNSWIQVAQVSSSSLGSKSLERGNLGREVGAK